MALGIRSLLKTKVLARRGGGVLWGISLLGNLWYWRWQVTAGRCAVMLRAGPLRVIECAGGGRLARAGWRTCWRLQVAADHSSGMILGYLL